MLIESVDGGNHQNVIFSASLHLLLVKIDCLNRLRAFCETILLRFCSAPNPSIGQCFNEPDQSRGAGFHDGCHDDFPISRKQ